MMSIELGQRLWDGIAFGMGQRLETLSAANRVSMVTGLEKNEWKGISKLQFNVKQIDISLRNEEDWNEFLSYFHIKLFDAFFRDFMYNKHYNNNNSIFHSSSLKAIEIDDIMEKIDTTRIGSIILVNSLSNSLRVAKNILDYNLAKKVSLGYGQPDQWDGISVNTIVFAPSYSSIEFSDYRNIYIFEDEIPFCLIDYKSIGNAKIHKIVNKDGQLKRDTKVGEEYLVQRDDFVSLYKWIQSMKNKPLVWQGWIELIEDYKKRIDKDVNGFKVKLVLKVFEELNFIKVESGHRLVRLQFNENPIPRDLQESSLYAYYYERLNMIKQQQICKI